MAKRDVFTLVLIFFATISFTFADECCCDSAQMAYEEEDGYEAYCFDTFYDSPCDQFCSDSDRTGIWLPESPPLFEPLVADPRQVVYSAGWRFNDKVFSHNVIDVSFGDTCPLYRWCEIGPWGGMMQIELEGAVWAIFEPLDECAPLVNADYYVGFPLTYATDCWSFRLRGYHISSHIGDEFLLVNPAFVRHNPSAEYLDFFASYYMTNDIRLYAGVGWILRQDETFRCSRFFTEEGAELHFSELSFCDRHDRILGEPFFGMNFRWTPDYNGIVDQTYVLGYEFIKTAGLARKLRVFGEFHDGFSVEGQFCRFRTRYFGIRFSYGY